MFANYKNDAAVRLLSKIDVVLRTINLEQANGNYEEQIDQMQGISEYYDTIICSEKVCNYSLLFTL